MALLFTQKLVERKLLSGGCEGKATVLAAQPTRTVSMTNGRLVKRRWILSLRVRPSGEPEFDVQFKQWLRRLHMPRRGEVVNVLYDPDNHSRTMLDPRLDVAGPDKPEDQLSAIFEIFDARAALAEAQTAPAEHQAELQELARYYAQGDLFDFEFVEQRRRILGEAAVPDAGARVAGTQQLAAGPVPGSAFVVGAGGESAAAVGHPAPAAEDPVKVLTRLAELHDSGALTDAEFQAAKDRALGE